MANLLITSSPEFNTTINSKTGLPCRVRLRVKWENEKDWLDHIIWMIPGWRPLEIWQKAYEWINEQNTLYYQLTGETAVTEEAKVDEFKLV